MGTVGEYLNANCHQNVYGKVDKKIVQVSKLDEKDQQLL